MLLTVIRLTTKHAVRRNTLMLYPIFFLKWEIVLVNRDENF